MRCTWPPIHLCDLADRNWLSGEASVIHITVLAQFLVRCRATGFFVFAQRLRPERDRTTRTGILAAFSIAFGNPVEFLR